MKILNFFSILFLFLGSFGLWYFLGFRVLVYLLFLLGVFSLYFLSIKKNHDYILILDIFLFSNLIYNFYFGGKINFIISLLSILAFLVFVSFAAFYFEPNLQDKKLFYIFTTILLLVSAQFFITLNFWPVDPLNKSLLITALVYFFGSIFRLKIHEHLVTIRKVFENAIVFIVLVFLIILTTPIVSF